MKDFYFRYRIRQWICVILSVCVAGIVTGIVLHQRMECVEAKVLQTQQDLAKEVFRFHVLANSDSNEDQQVKLKVRDAILKYMKTSMEEEISKEANAQNTKLWAKRHLNEVEQVADRVLQKEGYSYRAKAKVTTCFFPDKRYGDLIFPQGNYEALRIELGNAKGHNWWCVLYPNLCFTNTTCAVIDEKGRQDLKDALTEEEYEMVTATTEFKIRWFFFGKGAKEK